MRQRILVIVSETHAHVLPEVACQLSLDIIKKDVPLAIQSAPHLKCFKGESVTWSIEVHEVPPPVDGLSFNPNRMSLYTPCADFIKAQLREQGLMVV